MFFERNGLRHGELTLRESHNVEQAVSEQRRWGYRVRELGWSSDSNVLSVWIERQDGDLGKFPFCAMTLLAHGIQCNFGLWETITGQHRCCHRIQLVLTIAQVSEARGHCPTE